MRSARLLVLTATAVALVLTGHDLFLSFGSHFLEPDRVVTVQLVNGTFERSENAIDRDRMVDVSILGPASERIHPDEDDWSDDGITTFLRFRTGPPGTYVAGVSTLPRLIEMTSEAFNDYLEHDGVLDMLEARRAEGKLDQDVVERYAKHVKAIFQVGDAQTDAYLQPLGYPIEFIPLRDPLSLAVNDTLDVRLVLDGEPLAGVPVYAGHAGMHVHDDEGRHVEPVQVRTDDSGVALIPISTSGRWYVRVIHMVEVEEEGITHESKWATLTFQVR